MKATREAVDKTASAARVARDMVKAAGSATVHAAATVGRGSYDAAAATGRATIGAANVVVRATSDTAIVVNRATTDAASAVGRATSDATRAVGRVATDAAAVTVAIAQWIAAQPFDTTPHAPATLDALHREGFHGVSAAGTELWTSPSSVARIIRLPKGLRSGPGEFDEAIVKVAIADAGAATVSILVPSTGFHWTTTLPAKSPELAVPGLAINALGWANLGILVACSLESLPRATGISLIVRISLGFSVYGIGTKGVPLCELPIRLTQAAPGTALEEAALTAAHGNVPVCAPVVDTLSAKREERTSPDSTKPEPVGYTRPRL